MVKFTPYELALIKRNYELSDSIFERERAFRRPLYHFTNFESAEKIVQSQQFKMSFIKSTSDPLEFSLTLAECRDCLCIPDNWDGSKFSKILFKHFNDEAHDPRVRPYFISMTESRDVPFLKDNYGNCVLEFSKLDGFQDPQGLFEAGFSVIKCRYEDDIRAFVYKLIARWNDEVLQPTQREFGIKSHLLNVNDWHFALMEFCFVLALGVKRRAFAPEKEHRLIFTPQNPDESTTFYMKRKFHPIKSEFDRRREFLTLKLSKCGLQVKRII